MNILCFFGFHAGKWELGTVSYEGFFVGVTQEVSANIRKCVLCGKVSVEDI